MNENSALIYNEEEFVLQAHQQFTNAAKILDRYGAIIQSINGGLSVKQASGLSFMCLSKIVPFYLNLPNSNRASFFGMDDAIAINFVNRYPVCMEAFRSTQLMKNEEAQWNPSFAEAALFASQLFFHSYNGQNNSVRNLQRQVWDACKLILWRLSGSDISSYENRLDFFNKLVAHLKSAELSMSQAIENNASQSFVMRKMLNSMIQANSQAEMLIESEAQHENQ